MTDSKTAERKKLSVIPKGHWRNRYKSLLGCWKRGSTGEIVKDPICIAKKKWPSREIAEEKALRFMSKKPEGFEHVRYLGAVFFPDP